MEKKWEIGMTVENLEDFKEFAKGITREEFEMDCLTGKKNVLDFYIKEEYIAECPNDIGLHEPNDCISDCKKCWMDSVKDIYFKDDIENVKLNKETRHTYIENNIKNTNTYDYSKEYTLQEVFEFKEGTLFDCNGYRVKVKHDKLIYCVNIKNDLWIDCWNTKNWLIGKYKLIPIEKEITFQEILEYEGNCKIRVEHKILHETFQKQYGNLQFILMCLGKYHNSNEIKDIIKNGKWYAKECD